MADLNVNVVLWFNSALFSVGQAVPDAKNKLLCLLLNNTCTLNKHSSLRYVLKVSVLFSAEKTCIN